MAQICVLEASVQLKSCPKKFFNFLKNQSEHIPNKAQSENVHAVEIHKGDWNTPGSVKIWKFTIGLSSITFYYHYYIMRLSNITSIFHIIFLV
jgi:hypothetical protein